jgi:cell division protein FtsB
MRKKTSFLTKLAFLAIILFLIVQIFGVLKKLDTAGAARAELKSEIAKLQKSTGEMERRIEHSDEDSVIEEVARDNGLTLPGEQVFEG